MMIIAKRVLWGVMVLILFIIISPGYAKANDKSEVVWEIVTYDNHTIKETVKFNNVDINFNSFEWEKAVDGEVTTLVRTVDNWQSYNELTDKLPIKAKVKNYFLWHKTALVVTADQTTDGIVFAQTKDRPGVYLTISVPGFITAASGEKLNEMSAAWNMQQMKQLSEGQIILEAVTLEGFLIGVTGFLLGLIIIGIVFIRRMKKVEQIMEAEYSLENISLEEEQEADKYQNEDYDDWS